MQYYKTIMMTILNKALSANAVSAFLSGAGLIIFQHQIAAIFGVADTTVFWTIGIALLYFSASIVVEIKRQRTILILWIIVQDIIWILASFIIAIIKPFVITDAGYFLIKVFALIVLLFAIFQSVGLAQIDNVAGKNRKQLMYSRLINADKASVWKVISIVKDYHKMAPNIDNVTILSGEGKGMQRQCSHGKNSWQETCTLWNEGNQFSFEVNTSAPDYPYPLSYLKGTWVAKKHSATKTEIIMHFELTYKYKILNIIAHPFIKSKFNKICNELLDNWEKEIQREGN